MSLATKSWTAISIHRVVSQFLRSERYKFANDQQAVAVIDSANLSDPAENHHRLRLLFLIRNAMLTEIPPDTRWFEVQSLTEAQLPELHVIARCGWDDPQSSDRNALIKVAARRPQGLLAAPENWPSLILWGHGNAGPFTIIEGNNRLTAYVSAARKTAFSIPVIVGLSPSYCMWHFDDPGFVIANDVWQAKHTELFPRWT